jgi:hypothetical protein
MWQAWLKFLNFFSKFLGLAIGVLTFPMKSLAINIAILFGFLGVALTAVAVFPFYLIKQTNNIFDYVGKFLGVALIASVVVPIVAALAAFLLPGLFVYNAFNSLRLAILQSLDHGLPKILSLLVRQWHGKFSTLLNFILDVLEGSNKTQSTHVESVHKSVSESAIKLRERYRERFEIGLSVETTLNNIGRFLDTSEADELLEGEAFKLNAARRGFSRLRHLEFTDPRSGITFKQIMALCWIAIHDDELRVGTPEDAKKSFIEGLYEIQRGYNLTDNGLDQGGEDSYICPPGSFNKSVEKVASIHPDVEIIYITQERANAKFPIIVREEAYDYLRGISTAELRVKMSSQEFDKRSVVVVWPEIQEKVEKRMLQEFGSIFKEGADSQAYCDLVKSVEDIDLDIRRITPPAMDVNITNLAVNGLSTLRQMFFGGRNQVRQEDTTYLNSERESSFRV